MRDPSLDPVNLEIGRAEAVSEILAAQLLGDPDLLDPPSYGRRRLRCHPSDISESDTPSNSQSTCDTEARDSLGIVERQVSDLSFEEAEAWMRDLGYMSGNKPDWKRLLQEAQVKSTQYVLKDRWGKGQAPKDRQKVMQVLERAEQKRKERTPVGLRVLGIDEWTQLGAEISVDPDVFARELARLRALAGQVKKAHAARRALAEANAEIERSMSAFTSITPGVKR